LLSVSVVVGFAGPAHADPDAGGASDTDSAAFLDTLAAAGISYSRADLAIGAAEVVCRLAHVGKSGPEIVTILQNGNPDLTAEHAGQFIAIAERSYCPNQLLPHNPGNNE
jgi:hypothetical protein